MGKRSVHNTQVTDVEATESWNDKNTHVRVTQPEGFMCQVRVVQAGLRSQAGYCCTLLANLCACLCKTLCIRDRQYISSITGSGR